MPQPEREHLTLRAARFFGWHTKPRTSITTAGGVFIVGEDQGRKLLMLYREVGPQRIGHGFHVNLTRLQRDALVEALGGEADAA